MREEWRIRRLYAPPADYESDDASVPLLACSCSRPTVPYVSYEATSKELRVLPIASPLAPRLSLPFPAIDMAWCGLAGHSTDDVHYEEDLHSSQMCGSAAPQQPQPQQKMLLTTCHSQPMQLWHVPSGQLRASFVALNRSGVHCHAQSVLYLPTSNTQGYVVGGYGDFEDAVQLRVYDVTREGNEPLFCYRRPGYTCTSRSEQGRGLGRGFVVTALAAGPCALGLSSSSSSSLMVCGYRDKGVLDVIDLRHRSPAALLTGLRRGTSLIRCEDTLSGFSANGYGVYAAGRAGEDDVCCWDLRRPTTVLARFRRQVRGTQQPCEFVLLPALPSQCVPRQGSHAALSACLVSATSAGGVVVFDALASAEGVVDGRPLPAAQLGPTSSLAVLSQARREVAVVYGGRDYVLPRRLHGCRAARTLRPPWKMRGESEEEDEQEARSKACRQAAAVQSRKRPRSPEPHAKDEESTGSDDDESAARERHACCSEAKPNVAVVSLFDMA